MPEDAGDLLPAERKVVEELGHLPLDFRAMAAVSNLFRASAAIRRHMEAKILADDRLVVDVVRRDVGAVGLGGDGVA